MSQHKRSRGKPSISKPFGFKRPTANSDTRKDQQRQADRPTEPDLHDEVPNPGPELTGRKRPHWQADSTAEIAMVKTAVRDRKPNWSVRPADSTYHHRHLAQDHSWQRRMLWRFAGISVVIAILLVVVSGLREAPTRGVPLGTSNQDPIRSTTDALEPRQTFPHAEPKPGQDTQNQSAAHPTGSSAPHGIVDETTSISVTIASTSESKGKLIIDIKLLKPTEWPVDVTYITVDQTAEADKDYVRSDGILTIQPGAVAGDLTIPIIDDDDIESDETFQVLLAVESGETRPSHKTVMATIVDDDPAADTAPSSAQSSSGELDQTEVTSHLLAEPLGEITRPPQSTNGPVPARSNRPDRSPSDDLREADSRLRARAAKINKVGPTIVARTAKPTGHFRVQMAALREEVDAELLEMVVQQDLWRIGHDAAPTIRLM